MSAWGIIRNLKFSKLLTLSKTFLKNPRFFFPTWKATLETISFCDYKFGDQHHFDNPTNAFRHAYWNYLICLKCYKVTGNAEKSAAWAGKITDLHEDLSPNEELSREMDLHNNRIGREIFLDNRDGITESEQYFKKMMKEAIRVETLQEIRNVSRKLVYIEN